MRHLIGAARDRWGAFWNRWNARAIDDRRFTRWIVASFIVGSLLLLLTGCGLSRIFNDDFGRPNVAVSRIATFMPSDSLLAARADSADFAVLGTIMRVERDERYEDHCALVCRAMGGNQPPRFFRATVQAEASVGWKNDRLRDGGVRKWEIVFGSATGDSIPGVGLRAVFLARMNFWTDFGTYRQTRAVASSYFPKHQFVSLASWDDVLPSGEWLRLLTILRRLTWR